MHSVVVLRANLERRSRSDDARVGPLRMAIDVLGPTLYGRGVRSAADVRPVLQRVEAAAYALLAAAAARRRRLLRRLLVEVVTPAGGTALAPPRVVHADHAGLERAEEGLEEGHAREHDA